MELLALVILGILLVLFAIIVGVIYELSEFDARLSSLEGSVTVLQAVITRGLKTNNPSPTGGHPSPLPDKETGHRPSANNG